MNSAAISRGATPPGPDTYKRLLQDEAGPSEWYLFFYLKALSQITGKAQVRTSLTALREGTPDVVAIRMAPNTIRSALENLEATGMIQVTRVQKGVGVYLDVSFP